MFKVVARSMDGSCEEVKFKPGSNSCSIADIKIQLENGIPPYHEVKLFHNGQASADGRMELPPLEGDPPPVGGSSPLPLEGSLRPLGRRSLSFIHYLQLSATIFVSIFGTICHDLQIFPII